MATEGAGVGGLKRVQPFQTIKHFSLLYEGSILSTINVWSDPGSDVGYNAGMMNHGSPSRLLALMLVIVLGLSLAAPARAEAFEPLIVVAIAGAVVVVVILVVYLIVANTKGARMAKEAESVMVVCVESDGQPRNCSSLSRPGQRVEFESAVLLPQLAPQG
jgi:hypothetical protein